MSQVATLLATAETQLKNASSRSLKAPALVIESASKALQEARSALTAEDYPAVTRALEGVAKALQAALSEIDAAPAPAPGRRRR